MNCSASSPTAGGFLLTSVHSEQSGDTQRSKNMRKVLASFILTFVLGACTPNLLVPETTPSTVTIPAQTEIPTLVPTVDTTYGGCGYQWAYQDLPELTTQLDYAVKEFAPDSRAHATAFGENCLGADGQVLKFLAMETDFYVFISVEVLNDYQSFGDWIAQVMQVVTGFPPALIIGPKPGFVAFRFEKSESEFVALRVPIQQYKDTALNKSGEELFRMFYTTP